MVERFSHIDEECKYPWLKTLLDTYYISDRLVDRFLNDLQNSGVVIACGKGCHTCCLNMTVLLSAPELRGVLWYVSEVLSGNKRKAVKDRLLRYKVIQECPFLINDICSIYPMRPINCRQYFIGNTPCKINEDVLQVRPQDMLHMPKEVCFMTAMSWLECFGITQQSDKIVAFESGFLFKNTRPIHELDWTILANLMNKFD